MSKNLVVSKNEVLLDFKIDLHFLTKVKKAKTKQFYELTSKE